MPDALSSIPDPPIPDPRLDGEMRRDTHVLPLRVYWEDTDAGGIVYHANYLCFAERGRTACLHCLGLGQAMLLDTAGVAFAVRRLAIDYVAPAKLDDILEVHSRITDIGGATLTMEQIIRRTRPGLACQDLARVRVTLFVLSRAGRPVRIPADIRAALQRFVSPRVDQP